MEELQKMIADLSVNLKSGLSAVESKLESSHASMESKLASTQASVDATANSLLTLNTWKSGIDNQVSDLNQSMQELRKQVDRVAVGVGLSALGKPPGAAPPPAAPSVQAAGISLQGLNSGQGHGSTHDPRGQTAGSLTLALSTPVTGMEALKRRYPKAPAWGQADSQGEGSVMDQEEDAPSGKQRRRLRRVGRRPARIRGPEWTT
ncbi:hypothetical protein QYE76_030232 [Lolium multiflorum]|uniref:Uncharacterized protein n=1 Tax=Lolium multiflorum TaxID=4521 RepID=A0AAD8VHE7_LOLMU|nr:hypothetical protein QYE76_030232 [Lolium multiflorum]